MLDRKSLNIDLSHRCSLECPKCQRQTEWRNKGDKVPGRDITISEIKRLVKFFNKIYFCGQLSDPIHHPNFVEILKLCKDTDVVIHNSSSHKPRDYFIECFKANPNAHWIFGIDGLPEESHNYRIHQDGVKLFNIMLDAKKILQNPPTWQILTFKYNEDSIEKCKQIARENEIAIMVTQSSRWDKDDEYRPRESLNAV
tara:strand:+ start:106 stop:699 length:594 start_codon:yes stop_codon:yes gene_type:complete